MLALILHKVDGLNDIRVVERRRYAKLGCEFLDILLLRLVLAAFAEFLKTRSITRGEIGGAPWEGSALTLIAYSFSSVRSHLCARRTTLVAPLPIAIFWHTPYFCVRLPVLSPAMLFPRPSPASESDFFDDVERCELLRFSFGPLASRSFRLNLCELSPLSECTDAGFFGEGVTMGASVLLARRSRPASAKAGGGGTIFPPATPADMLGARLGGWLAGLLGARLGGALVGSHALSGGDVVDGECIGLCGADPCRPDEADEAVERETELSFSSAPRV